MLAILAAVMLAAAPGSDTVYTTNGGRIVGTVIEETPQGITVQLPDGSTRRLARNQVTRIEYSDGSVSTPNRAPPPAQPPTYPAQPPPPAYRPPPPPSYAPPYPPPAAPYQPMPPGAAPRGMPQLMPFWASFGIGGTFFSGEAAGGIPMGNLFDSQVGLWFEGGGRITPHLGLGLYLDLGIGDPSREVSAACAASGTSCTASSGRVGPLLRYTFEPYASSTPWLAVGTGYEWANATLDYGGANQQYFGYHGWEMLRLMGGVDLRTSPVFGFGLYAGVSFGRYSSYEEPGAGLSYGIGDERTHTTVEAGLRFTLFP